MTITQQMERSGSPIAWPEDGSACLVITVTEGDRYYTRRVRPDITRDEKRLVIDDLIHHPGWWQQV